MNVASCPRDRLLVLKTLCAVRKLLQFAPLTPLLFFAVCVLVLYPKLITKILVKEFSHVFFLEFYGLRSNN